MRDNRLPRQISTSTRQRRCITAQTLKCGETQGVGHYSQYQIVRQSIFRKPFPKRLLMKERVRLVVTKLEVVMEDRGQGHNRISLIRIPVVSSLGFTTNMCQVYLKHTLYNSGLGRQCWRSPHARLLSRRPEVTCLVNHPTRHGHRECCHTKYAPMCCLIGLVDNNFGERVPSAGLAERKYRRASSQHEKVGPLRSGCRAVSLMVNMMSMACSYQVL